jgi:hypothetical protein
MKKPVLYIQSAPDQKKTVWFDFCYSAQIGAQNCNIQVKKFSEWKDIPADPTNIIVGSVEMCKGWLQQYYTVPYAIDLSVFNKYLGRKIDTVLVKDLEYPTFIKPVIDVKAFTGFEAVNESYVQIFAEGYTGHVWSQEIVDIVSEYRMYITNNKILGMKHYSGDCLVFPDAKFIAECFEFSKTVLDYHSYALDFGVLSDGRTILIEPNDGWAIGNYGLEPSLYYRFIRNRWLQLTGIRKRMDY